MIRRMGTVWVLLIVLCFLPQIFVSSAAADGVQEGIERFLRETGTPGIALSVMHKGDANPRNWYAGLADVELNMPVNPSTTFRIGSITKVFTAAGIMKLVENRTLSLDTTMIRTFPDLQDAGRITVENLLNHSCGLPDMLLVEPFASNMAKPYTPEQILAMVTRNGKVDFLAGNESEYTNSGYLVLGLLMEKASGLSYEDFLQRNIIGPLGMQRTALGSDTKLIDGRAAGYVVDQAADSGAQVLNGSFVSIIPPFASGGMMSRPADFIRLIDLEKVLKPGAVKSMMRVSPPGTPVRISLGGKGGESVTIRYGFGYEILQFDNSKGILAAKDGVIPGFASWYVYFPEKKLAIAASTNNEKATLPLLLMIRELASSL